MEITRRRLLTGGGATAVVAAASVGATLLLEGDAQGAVTPGEMLMTEHGVLKRVLLIYRATVDRAAAGTAVDHDAVQAGAAIIHDHIEGFHELLEETYVFPPLMSGPLEATISTLLVQHGRGRELTARIQTLVAGPASGDAELVGHLKTFVRMYEPHEAREDTVVFPALRATLGDERLASLAQTFIAKERQQLGDHVLADVTARLSTAEDAVGIYDLDGFTPPHLAT